MFRARAPIARSTPWPRPRSASRQTVAAAAGNASARLFVLAMIAGMIAADVLLTEAP
jgi:hypothetical protein